MSEGKNELREQREYSRTVRVLDIPLTRVRRPVDLVLMLATLAGILAVCVLSVYAYRTTTAVTLDVQSVLARVLRNILLVPVNAIEGFLTLILPIAVIVEQLIHKQVRAVLDAVAAALAALAVTAGAIWLLQHLTPDALVRAFTRYELTGEVVTISLMVAALVAFLTGTGTRDERKLVAVSWNLLWIVLIVSVITGESTLAGAIVSVLLGRAVGLGMRYASGVLSRRAHGQVLVDGIRKAGVDAVSVVRLSENTSIPQLVATTVSTTAPIGYTQPDPSAEEDGSTSEVVAEETLAPSPTEPTDGPGPHVQESATIATQREGANRIYAVTDRQSRRWDAVVLDSDRQVIGWLNGVLSTLTRRGLARRSTTNLRQSAERASLMYYAAAAAGVNCPRLHGIAEAGASVLLVGEHITNARQLANLNAIDITDEVMDHAWQQLNIAHEAGLAHRNISAMTVYVVTEGETAGQVWLNGWEEGEIASSSLARRVDRAQLLTLFSLRVGTERAIAAASKNLTPGQLAEIAPLLQPIAMPALTRANARANKASMRSLRSELIDYIPTAGEIQPIQLARFSLRTAVTLVIALVAIWILLTTLNFQTIASVIAGANPWWMVAAFALGLLTYLGSAMGLVGLSPDKLGMWRTTLVQVAASVIGLVAPAGVGPAALNLRYMQKRGVATPMALATVALLQVSQFVTTVLLLLAIALLTGSSGALQQLPSGAVLIAVGIVVVLAGAVMAIGSLRRWLLAKITPTLRQVWPRVVWVLGQPGRLALAIGGNLLMTIGFLAAFGASLAAFGGSLPLTALAIVYLTGTAVGSAIPTPGGIGTVELALSTGLTTAGIGAAAAASSAVLFRVLTFWIRVPLGWWALRYLQKRNLV